MAQDIKRGRGRPRADVPADSIPEGDEESTGSESAARPAGGSDTNRAGESRDPKNWAEASKRLEEVDGTITAVYAPFPGPALYTTMICSAPVYEGVEWKIRLADGRWIK